MSSSVHVFRKNSAPASAPTDLGQHWVNETSGEQWLSVGTASVADWILVEADTDTGITELTGDVTAGPGSGSQAATLATVNADVGSFTNASVTVNAKGLVTAAASGAVPLYPNSPITGATKTKITYDANGLVTSGDDATTADITDSTDKRYVTDAELVVIGNTSGTNTGDQDLSGLVPYVGALADLDLGNTQKVTNCQDPVNPQDVVTKFYADSLVGGFVPYTGASADLDLGAHGLSSASVNTLGITLDTLSVGAFAGAWLFNSGIAANGLVRSNGTGSGGAFEIFDFTAGTYQSITADNSIFHFKNVSSGDYRDLAARTLKDPSILNSIDLSTRIGYAVDGSTENFDYSRIGHRLKWSDQSVLFHVYGDLTDQSLLIGNDGSFGLPVGDGTSNVYFRWNFNADGSGSVGGYQGFGGGSGSSWDGSGNFDIRITNARDAGGIKWYDGATRSFNDEYGVPAIGIGGTYLRYMMDPGGYPSVGYGLPRNLVRDFPTYASSLAMKWNDSQLLAINGTTVVFDWSAQITTAITGATFVSNLGTPITDTDTFDGYTLAQIVAGLRALKPFV